MQLYRVGSAMHFSLPALEIGPNEGFEPAKDIFKRKGFGDGLTSLLEASSDPLVIALNGQWGTGKSIFLKMFAGALRQKGYPVIYFDAFAHDYLADAFEALAGEIIDLANQLKKPEASKKVKQAAIEAGKVLFKVGAGIGIRVATAGLLDAAHVSGAIEDAKDAVGGASDKIVERALSSRNDQRNTLAAFRETLSSLPALLSDKEKPLVFIIDELDRCRPSFALEILERMKHFFAVDGLHFVLGVHAAQLECSVRVSYGAEIDASLYLQKFINLTVNLDVPSEHRHDGAAQKYVNYLVQKMEFRPQDADAVRACGQIITAIARHNDIKLRTIERIMSTLAITLAFSPTNSLREPSIISGLCVMKVIAPTLFEKAQAGTLVYQEVSDLFKLKQKDDHTDWPGEYFITWWRYGTDASVGQETIERVRSALFHYNLRDRTRLVPTIANYIVDGFVRPDTI